jgi:hypothetical protein
MTRKRNLFLLSFRLERALLVLAVLRRRRLHLAMGGGLAALAGVSQQLYSVSGPNFFHHTDILE